MTKDSSGEDWHKPRNPSQHFTADEVAFVKAGWIARRSSRDVARDLQCNSRSVRKRYELLALEGVDQVQIAAPFAVGGEVA